MIFYVMCENQQENSNGGPKTCIILGGRKGIQITYFIFSIFQLKFDK